MKLKKKKYERIWSLTLMSVGVVLFIIGYIVFPMVSLVIMIGMSMLGLGIINLLKNIK